MATVPDPDELALLRSLLAHVTSNEVPSDQGGRFLQRPVAHLSRLPLSPVCGRTYDHPRSGMSGRAVPYRQRHGRANATALDAA